MVALSLHPCNTDLNNHASDAQTAGGMQYDRLVHLQKEEEELLRDRAADTHGKTQDMV